MPSKADLLAQLRTQIASLEQQQQPAEPRNRPPAPAGREAPRPAEESPADDAHSPQAAYQKILRIIGLRERSTAYLRQRLAQDEFSPEAIEEALEKAQRLSLVDDRRYGDALIRMKLAAGRGLRDAEREIEELGIDPCTLDAWQEHHQQGSEAEVERALAVLRRRPPRAKQAREAAFRKLVTRGFSTDVASTAARRWHEETQG